MSTWRGYLVDQSGAPQKAAITVDQTTGVGTLSFFDANSNLVQSAVALSGLNAPQMASGATVSLGADASGNLYDAAGNGFQITDICLATWKQLPRALKYLKHVNGFGQAQPDPSRGIGTPGWQASLQYQLGALRSNGGNLYRCTQAGVSASSGGPTGTSTGIVDGGAKWDYMTTNPQVWGLSASATVTVTSASPAVVTWTGHGLTVSQRVGFNSTGALPGGISTEKSYYVASVIDANTFTISDRVNGSAVATTSTGSGTITCIRSPLFNELRVSAGAVQYRVQTGRSQCWPSITAGGPTGTSTAYDGTTNYSVTTAVGGNITKTAHGLSENTPVAFSGSVGGGMAGGTIYYVHVVDANTFNIMATPNGAIVNITSIATPTMYVNAIVYSALANYYIDTNNGSAANSSSAYNAAKVAFPTVAQNTNYWVAAGSVFNVDYSVTGNFFSISQPGVSVTVYDPATGNEIISHSNPFERALQGGFVTAAELATKYFQVIGNSNAPGMTSDNFTGTNGSAFSGNAGGTQSSYTLIRGAYVTGCPYAAFRGTGNSKWRVEDCAIAHNWRVQTATSNSLVGTGLHHEGWGGGHQTVRCYMWDIGEDVLWQSSGFGSLQDWTVADCAMQHNPRSTYNANHMDAIQSGQFPGSAVARRCIIECNLPLPPLIGGSTLPIGAGIILDQTGQWIASTAMQVDARVVNGANTYICRKAGTTASSGGPTGTGTGITDGTATWDFLNSVPANLQVQDCIIMSNVLGLNMTNGPGTGAFNTTLLYCNKIGADMPAQNIAFNVTAWPLINSAVVFENPTHPLDANYSSLTLAVNEQGCFKYFGSA